MAYYEGQSVHPFSQHLGAVTMASLQGTSQVYDI